MVWLICAGLLIMSEGTSRVADIPHAVSTWLAPERFSSVSGFDESAIVDHINDLRARPERWRAVVDTLIDLWEQGRPPRMLQHLIGSEGPKLLIEVRDVLDSMTPVQPVDAKSCLRRVAMKHAIDVARNPGGNPHVSANGRTLTRRIVAECPDVASFAECVDHLSSHASTVVLRMLFDPDVPGRGHRATLLDPSYHMVGVGGAPCTKHPVLGNGYVVVLTFAAD